MVISRQPKELYMPIIVEKFKCIKCGQLFDSYQEALDCEDGETDPFLFDIHDEFVWKDGGRRYRIVEQVRVGRRKSRSTLNRIHINFYWLLFTEGTSNSPPTRVKKSESTLLLWTRNKECEFHTIPV